jgi:AGZA family xanthine/uracil permease-like MFS transporter
MLQRWFRLAENQTSVRTEVLAGLTTFLTMAYILFVQPLILAGTHEKPTGLDRGAVLLATALSAAIATALMGLLARYPIALAPGMGQNVFFVTVTAQLAALGYSEAWRVALGVVFLSGVICVVLSLLRVRQAIIEAISPSMQNAIAVGIGLFIAFIGLQHGGLIVGRPVVLVGLAPNLATPDIAVFGLGLLTIAVLLARRVRGAILWGILAAALLAGLLGKVAWPESLVGLPQIEKPAAFQLDVLAALTLQCLPFIVIFAFTDLFDTVGTLIGVAGQAGFMRDGKLPRADQALLADSTGTVIGACLGTSTVTSYIESAAGVEHGGRTGLTSLSVAALFLAALAFSPLVAVVGNYPPITAPALVAVGSMMARNVVKVQWHEPSEAIPALLVMLGVPLSYSIADGLALGFIAYPLVKLLSGRIADVKWLTALLSLLLLAYFLFVRTAIQQAP